MDTFNAKVMRHLRECGYTCAIVERWNSFVKIRQDLFGFCDMLAVKGHTTHYLQITSRGHRSDRLDKIKENPYARRLISEGALVHLALCDVVNGRLRSIEFVQVTPQMLGIDKVSPRLNRKNLSRFNTHTAHSKSRKERMSGSSSQS